MRVGKKYSKVLSSNPHLVFKNNFIKLAVPLFICSLNEAKRKLTTNTF